MVSENIMRQNSARQGGGAIHATGSTVTLIDNVVVKNSQTVRVIKVAAFVLTHLPLLTMINNTVSDNSSAGTGGGLACSIGGRRDRGARRL
jgi:predicted outer membrane repeat protein